jgi:hypothetical protein
MQTPGSGNPISHLWFVITEPDENGFCVIVSLTTLRYAKDQTVTLVPGDHPYISHASIILYAKPLIVEAQKLKTLIAAGTIQRHDDCTDALLKLIQQGVSASPFTPKKVIEFCRRAWAK